MVFKYASKKILNRVVYIGGVGEGERIIQDPYHAGMFDCDDVD